MKPKTKLQFDVIGKSQELNCDNDFILQWAKNDCLKYIGYATKSRVVCMACGDRFSPDVIGKRKKVKCPHCGTMLQIEQSRKTTFDQKIYVGYTHVMYEYQVVRYFEISSYHKAGKPTKYFSYEVLQHWIREDGKYETVARNHNASWCCDSWSGDMEIRKNYQRNYYYNDKYDIYTKDFHPKSVVKPKYKKYGIDNHLAGLTFIEAIRVIPEKPKFETLLKAKQYSSLSHFANGNGVIERYWPSIKICIRNKYIINDTKIWTDYIDLLCHFRKDIHNAKYVCPANLNAEHDRLTKKKRKEQERQELERNRKKVHEYEQKFKELKGQLIGFSFSAGDFIIKTLDSVQEYLEEGDALHHCVYTNEYFLKKNTLCLSARIDNMPVETIELNIKKMKIEQSRGKFNQPSEYHDKIINLVNANIPKIAKRIREKESV